MINKERKLIDTMSYAVLLKINKMINLDMLLNNSFKLSYLILLKISTVALLF